MTVHNRLRGLQDRARNAGWRIQWIPWQKPGQLAYVYNTPLTLFTGFGGAALFVGTIAYMLFPIFKTGRHPISSPEQLYPLIGVAASGLALILIGRIYATFVKQAGWKKVNAHCIDREVQKRSGYSGQGREVAWEYRLLCTFTFNGRKYEVTPEASHVVAFTSRERLEQYLKKRIGPGGACRLWIDARNPQHAIFDKKQRI